MLEVRLLKFLSGNDSNEINVLTWKSSLLTQAHHKDCEAQKRNSTAQRAEVCITIYKNTMQNLIQLAILRTIWQIRRGGGGGGGGTQRDKAEAFSITHISFKIICRKDECGAANVLL